MSAVRVKEPAVESPLAAGETLAPGYRVLGHLSRGRQLDAYEVWSDERGCRCVVKALRPDRGDDARARARLRSEGRLLLGLTHPHLVRAYELLDRPRQALVLEALTGETLAHMIDVDGRLAVPDLAALGLHLCSAVGYLHRRGFLHLDLKPSNVVSDWGQAKVIDLSVARPPGRARRPVGTRVYMAPEQALCGPLSPATDAWGIGAVLYESATGRRPFAGLGRDGGTPQLERRAEPVATLRRLPRPLAAAIDACLDPDPPGRPDTAELAAALDPLA